MSDGHLLPEDYKSWSMGEPYPEEDMQGDRFDYLESSDIDCPRCKRKKQLVKMLIEQDEIRAPDDIRTVLVCPACLWEEKE